MFKWVTSWLPHKPQYHVKLHGNDSEGHAKIWWGGHADINPISSHTLTFEFEKERYGDYPYIGIYKNREKSRGKGDEVYYATHKVRLHTEEIEIGKQGPKAACEPYLTLERMQRTETELFYECFKVCEAFNEYRERRYRIGLSHDDQHPHGQGLKVSMLGPDFNVEAKVGPPHASHGSDTWACEFHAPKRQEESNYYFKVVGESDAADEMAVFFFALMMAKTRAPGFKDPASHKVSSGE